MTETCTSAGLPFKNQSLLDIIATVEIQLRTTSEQRESSRSVLRVQGEASPGLGDYRRLARPRLSRRIHHRGARSALVALWFRLQSPQQPTRLLTLSLPGYYDYYDVLLMARWRGEIVNFFFQMGERRPWRLFFCGSPEAQMRLKSPVFCFFFCLINPLPSLKPTMQHVLC